MKPARIALIAFIAVAAFSAGVWYSHRNGLNGGPESGERKILGINYLQKEEEIPIDIFQVDPKDEDRQVERLKSLRARRDGKLVQQRLEALGEAAVKKTQNPKGVNIMPTVLEAVRAYATIGEIYGVMRKVFGEFKGVTHTK